MIIIPQEVYIELFDQIDENLKAALQRDLTGFQSQQINLNCLVCILPKLRNGSWTESSWSESDQAKDPRGYQVKTQFVEENILQIPFRLNLFSRGLSVE